MACRGHGICEMRALRAAVRDQKKAKTHPSRIHNDYGRERGLASQGKLEEYGHGDGEQPFAEAGDVTPGVEDHADEGFRRKPIPEPCEMAEIVGRDTRWAVTSTT